MWLLSNYNSEKAESQAEVYWGGWIIIESEANLRPVSKKAKLLTIVYRRVLTIVLSKRGFEFVMAKESFSLFGVVG